MVELSMKFDFTMSNNQVDYEALIERLQLVANVSATRLTVCSNSHIVMSQVTGTYQAKGYIIAEILGQSKGSDEDSQGL